MVGESQVGVDGANVEGFPIAGIAGRPRAAHDAPADRNHGFEVRVDQPLRHSGVGISRNPDVVGGWRRRRWRGVGLQRLARQKQDQHRNFHRATVQA